MFHVSHTDFKLSDFHTYEIQQTFNDAHVCGVKFFMHIYMYLFITIFTSFIFQKFYYYYLRVYFEPSRSFVCATLARRSNFEMSLHNNNVD